MLTPRGPVSRADAIYVRRPADDELRTSLASGVFSYVLGPRQIGKTSLSMRVAEQLTQQGRRCARIDLTLIGRSGVTESDWYFSVMSEIARGLGLPDPLRCWQENIHRTVVDRWVQFLEQEVVGDNESPVVIFIDEIDNLLGLDFRTDFFASLRGIGQEDQSKLPRGQLTFCVLGVALPLQLCPDPARTPFNIGREIQLHDFTDEQAKAFLGALHAGTDVPEALLSLIMFWTNGHPAMTQRLCDELLARWEDPSLVMPRPTAQLKPELDSLVQQVFVQDALSKDPILAEIAHRFDSRLGFLSQRDLKTCLFLYQDILNRPSGIALHATSNQHLWLQLFGLCAVRGEADKRSLVVRNRIVAVIFNKSWVGKAAEQLDLDTRVLAWKQTPSEIALLAQGHELQQAQQRAARNELSSDELLYLRASETNERKQRGRKRLLVTLSTLGGAIVVIGSIVFIAVYLRSTHNRELHNDLLEYRRKVAALEEQLRKISLPDFSDAKDIRAVCDTKQPEERERILRSYQDAVRRRQADIEKFQKDLQTAQGLVAASLKAADLLQEQLKVKSLALVNAEKLQQQVSVIKSTLADSQKKVQDLETRVDTLKPKPLLGVLRAQPEVAVVPEETPRRIKVPFDKEELDRFEQLGRPLDPHLRRAQDLYVNENCRAAIKEAGRSKDAANAWRLKGACGCYMSNTKLVANAMKKTSANGREFIRYVCSRENRVKIKQKGKTWQVTLTD
jgi:hypothetical protein